jgi:hypothetical protein
VSRAVGDLVRIGSVLVLVVATGAGCGARSAKAPESSRTWSPAACARQADAIASEARTILRSYKPGFGIGSIADVAYFGMRTELRGFVKHQCPRSTLGHVLTTRFTAKQRAALYSHLPTAPIAYFRRAIASAQR